MDSSRRPSATNARRTPLGDATSKANSQAGPPKMGKLTDIPTLTVENRPISSSSDHEPRVPILAIRPPFDEHRNSTASQASSSNPFPPPRKTHIGPWQLGRDVGEGGTCLVRQVRHSKTGTIAVAKIINKTVAEKVRARSLANLLNRVEDGDYRLAGKFHLPVGLEREIAIMRLLQHPNIARLYDVWENRNEIYLIMEYVDGGELFHYLARESPIAEKDAIYLFRQLVDAVVYCHRMQIYHRDLKPENILLSQKPFAVKLIDFGMSAFQPTGESLKTPCGSPHYAAPELLHGMPYDGSKTDVWSLAVILFVMLTGDPPFNYRNSAQQETELKLQRLYTLIKAAKVKIPDHLSKEAKDLFKKVFIADPRHRIGLDELWHHPLLRKYEDSHRHHGLEIRSLNHSSPDYNNWKMLKPNTIDPDILRSLLTLWHDSDEGLLIRKLCSHDHNQEKLFYMALKKYHEEQKNALDTSPVRGLVTSQSDHHHSYAARSSVRKTNKPSHKRSGSKFSVYHEEHLASKHSFFDSNMSLDVTDPFQPSQQLEVMSSNNMLQNSSIKRVVSSGKMSENRTSLAVKDSLRVEALKRQNSKHNSALSKRSRGSVGRLSVGSFHSRTLSYASTCSVQRSPAPIAASRRHKRNVSFNHLRRGSPIVERKTVSRLDVPRSDSPLLPSSPNRSMLCIPSSPPELPGSIHVNKRTYISPVPQTPRTRTLKVIELEARRVSNELEKACEEAFFRSSFSEKSDRSSASDVLPQSNETPPSSISNRSANIYPHTSSRLDKAILNRPLPPTPKDKPSAQNVETPRTYTTRQLQEMRQKLAVRYAQEDAPNEHFNAILKQLDSLMPSELERHHGYNPNQNFLLSNNDFLQSIPEEDRGQSSEECFNTSHDTVLRRKISSKDFVGNPNRNSSTKEPNTIRVVELSSPPSPWLPLNIRKTSDSSNRSSVEPSGVSHGRHVNEDVEQSTFITEKPKYGHGHSKAPSRLAWWRRVSQPKDTVDRRFESSASPGAEFADFDDRTARRDRRMAPVTRDIDQSLELLQTPTKMKRKSRLRRASGMNEQAVDELADGTELKLPGLRGWFRKKTKTIYNVERESPSHTQKQIAGGIVRSIPVAKVAMAEQKPPGEWNLLQRIFRIKPESRVIVMNQPRLAARNLICALLLQEEINGVCDLMREPQSQFAYTGRLDVNNKWNLKPVSFAVELFSILRDGKISRLTAIRFTQTQGSGPSLRKLVDLLSVFLENGYLHEDTKETKEIARLILTGRVENDDSEL